MKYKSRNIKVTFLKIDYSIEAHIELCVRVYINALHTSSMCLRYIHINVRQCSVNIHV